jgi:hypothetical protein
MKTQTKKKKVAEKEIEIDITRSAPKSRAKKSASKSRTKKSAPSVKKPSAKAKKAPADLGRAKKRIAKKEKFIEENNEFVNALAKSLPKDDADLSGEQEYLKEYLYLYRSLKALVRKTKKRAMLSNSSKDIYALSTLMSQQREVIADIRTIADLSGQVQILINLVLQPMVSEIGQVVVNSFYQQRKLLLETTKDNETKFAVKQLSDITGEITRALQVHYEQAASKINEILVGAPEETPKRKRKS